MAYGCLYSLLSSNEACSLPCKKKSTKWALIKKEFSNINLDDILYNWEVCMGCGLIKERRTVHWSPTLIGALKFNADGAARGRPASVDGASHNCKGEVLLMFSKHV